MHLLVFGVLHDSVGIASLEKEVTKLEILPDVVFLEQSDGPLEEIDTYLLEQGTPFIQAVGRLFKDSRVFGIDGTLKPEKNTDLDIKEGFDFADEEIQDAVFNLIDGVDIASDDYIKQSDLLESVLTYEAICKARESRMATQIKDYVSTNSIVNSLAIVGSYHATSVVRELREKHLEAECTIATPEWNIVISDLIDMVRYDVSRAGNLRAYMAVTALNRLCIENQLSDDPELPKGFDKIARGNELYAVRLYYETLRRAEHKGLEVRQFLQLAINVLKN